MAVSEASGLRPIRVLFSSSTVSVCPQMAAGWLVFLGGDLYDVACTPSEPPGTLSADAVATMGEVGVSLSRVRPAPLASVLGQTFDFVISIGERPSQDAAAVQPLMQQLDWLIDDPRTSRETPATRLVMFRRAREEIRRQVADFVLANPPTLFHLLGERVTWGLLEGLGRGDRRLQEFPETARVGATAVQERLRRLQSLGLVIERRSDFDRATSYYSLALDRLRSAVRQASARLHPALIAADDGPTQGAKEDSRRPVRVLFLCTHNSARSQMAEGIARQIGQGVLEAYSAGSDPTPVRPEAVLACREFGVDISRQESKHLGIYLDSRFDYVVTVCDRQRESCPVFPGDPEQIHWSIADPALVVGSEERSRAFRETALLLVNRIRLLLLLVERDRRERGSGDITH